MSEVIAQTNSDPDNATGVVEDRELPFEFRGDGTEYFKIWIVNILLTIVTLGIYSAWAKVRSKRYFYSNLYLDGESFRYLAEPLVILKSRIIAVIALISFVLLSGIFPIAYLFISLLFLVLVPFLVVRSLAFNHRMTAYRNVQFRFNGSYVDALEAMFLWPMLGGLTAGILYPKAILKGHEFIVRNSSYGTATFNFNARTWDYARVFLILVCAVVATLFLTLGLTMLFDDMARGLGSIVTLAGYIFAGIYLTVMLTNLYYNSASLQAHKFASNLQFLGYMKVFLVNAILTVVTLGLFLPFAKVRMARYRADNTQFTATGSLEEFAAAEREQVSALGEELGEVFDFDVGAI